MQNSPSIEVRNDSLDLPGNLFDCLVVVPVVGGGQPCRGPEWLQAAWTPSSAVWGFPEYNSRGPSRISTESGRR